ncbi:hypothetical protein Zm00014a_043559 [Zea mays]|uniref:Uncharacterized protein n=1 Tax=Zea mays TaxID=4577 RepID=A0A3L6DY83_MAIZE|nr:hypothetical protein Zm00014a_043559 [Zea mays]
MALGLSSALPPGYCIPLCWWLPSTWSTASSTRCPALCSPGESRPGCTEPFPGRLLACYRVPGSSSVAAHAPCSVSLSTRLGTPSLLVVHVLANVRCLARRAPSFLRAMAAVVVFSCAWRSSSSPMDARSIFPNRASLYWPEFPGPTPCCARLGRPCWPRRLPGRGQFWPMPPSRPGFWCASLLPDSADRRRSLPVTSGRVGRGCYLQLTGMLLGLACAMALIATLSRLPGLLLSCPVLVTVIC